MATTITPEVSMKNPYYLTKHRYYELKHFCLQYSMWQKELSAISFINAGGMKEAVVQTSDVSDLTAKIAEDRLYYQSRINMLRVTANQTDPLVADYLLKAVTQGISYDVLKVNLDNIPCTKDEYYKLYRKFFWLLDKKRR